MTYLTSAEVKDIVHFCGVHIRIFLGNANPGAFSGDAKDAIVQFHQDPAAFADEQLLEKGADVDAAHQYNVRIELRGLSSQGAAQVVAKGIWGADRDHVIFALRKELARHAHPIVVRSAGSSSLEFNRQGVDKSLPIAYVKAHLHKILKDMGYVPGQQLNTAQDQILIAADGDGTIYDGPKLTHLPMLKDGPVFKPLLAYLTAGGVFILISGNDLARSFKRLINGIPKDLYHRILIAANGGADLACVAHDGQPHYMMEYRKQALLGIKDNQASGLVRVIYLGDDASPNGNDRAAFEAVGSKNAILVKNLTDTGNYIQGFLNERKISSS